MIDIFNILDLNDQDALNIIEKNWFTYEKYLNALIKTLLEGRICIAKYLLSRFTWNNSLNCDGYIILRNVFVNRKNVLIDVEYLFENINLKRMWLHTSEHEIIFNNCNFILLNKLCQDTDIYLSHDPCNQMILKLKKIINNMVINSLIKNNNFTDIYIKTTN